MIHLEKYFRHDDTVEDIVLLFGDKTLSFTISNYLEETGDYKRNEIRFQQINHIRINHLSFIDDAMSLELDILSFDKKEIENDLYEFELILKSSFGTQDVQFLFVCHLNNIQLR